MLGIDALGARAGRQQREAQHRRPEHFFTNRHSHSENAGMKAK
jgi:hypothetical protein